MPMQESGSAAVSVVDDDPSSRRSLKNLLSSVGFRVETFESAEAFLQSARPSSDCLVIDLRMPGMSGLDLLRHLTSTGSTHPVIVVTAHGDGQTREQSLRNGAVAYFEKPCHGPALLEAVREAVSAAPPRLARSALLLDADPSVDPGTGERG